MSLSNALLTRLQQELDKLRAQINQLAITDDNFNDWFDARYFIHRRRVHLITPTKLNAT